MFDLKLYFTGIMLFVAEETEMQALMPQTSRSIPATVIPGGGDGHPGHGDHAGHQPGGTAHTGHPVEPHVARLTFDTAYLRQGSTAEDGVIAHVSLDGTRLVLPTVGEAYQRGVPRQIAPVPRPVRQDVLAGNNADANKLLACRVRVTSGEATGVGKGLCWEFDDGVRRVPHQMEWTIAHIDAPSLELEITAPEGEGKAGSVPRLFPIEGRPMELYIWHAPPFELPPGGIEPEKPKPGDRNHHIGHVDILLEAGEPFPEPVLASGECDDAEGEDADEGSGKSRGRDPDKGGLSLPCTPTRFP